MVVSARFQRRNRGGRAWLAIATQTDLISQYVTITATAEVR